MATRIRKSLASAGVLLALASSSVIADPNPGWDVAPPTRPSSPEIS